ncbi:MAG: tol-pal system YbgF family protein [Crocinitomicaceae bacterium]
MRNLGLNVILAALVFASCENAPSTPELDSDALDTAVFLTEIKTIDSILAAGVPDKKDVTKAIVLYQNFANYFPDDSKTPDYLFRVSDFHLGGGRPDQAVRVLSDIIEKYPDYERLESVYFARASHVDFDIRDTTLAKTYYNDFLKMYPDSKFSENVNSRLKTVSLSIEDLVKQFEENASKSDN